MYFNQLSMFRLSHTKLYLSFIHFQFIDKITKKYKQGIEYHKNCKLFVVDNACGVKRAYHCEPFSLRVGGFCAVERSDDFTVDFMNKR